MTDTNALMLDMGRRARAAADALRATTPQARTEALTRLAVGLRAAVDRDSGFWKTLSNVAVQGLVGVEKDVQWDIANEDSEAKLLNDAGIVTTVRKTRGDDIDAACGQLAGDVQDRTRVQERMARRRTVVLHPVPADAAQRKVVS